MIRYHEIRLRVQECRLLIVPVYNDLRNYIYILHDSRAEVTVAVDPTEAGLVKQVLQREGWHLHYILATHHHHDHVGGNIELKETYGCRVVGFAGDKSRIPGISEVVEAEDLLKLGSFVAQVMHIPGHTKGHIAYYLPQLSVLFCGDTLFSLGCGRLFEGAAEEMVESLSSLAALPDDTLICCAHEYTVSNARFAMTLEPKNPKLSAMQKRAIDKQAAGEPTIPSKLSDEKLANPFLRCDQPQYRKYGADAVAAFAAIRAMKDKF